MTSLFCLLPLAPSDRASLRILAFLINPSPSFACGAAQCSWPLSSDSGLWHHLIEPLSSDSNLQSDHHPVVKVAVWDCGITTLSPTTNPPPSRLRCSIDTPSTYPWFSNLTPSILLLPSLMKTSGLVKVMVKSKWMMLETRWNFSNIYKSHWCKLVEPGRGLQSWAKAL